MEEHDPAGCLRYGRPNRAEFGVLAVRSGNLDVLAHAQSTPRTPGNARDSALSFVVAVRFNIGRAMLG
jgi:hypothetical protein